jgi:hypothetical protein
MSPMAASGTVAVLLPGAFTRCTKRRSPRSPPFAPTACRWRSHRLQSRLLAHDVDASDDEHGLHAVRAHAGGGAARRDVERGPRARASDRGTSRRGCAPILRSGMSRTPAHWRIGSASTPCIRRIFGGRPMADIADPRQVSLSHLEAVWRTPPMSPGSTPDAGIARDAAAARAPWRGEATSRSMASTRASANSPRPIDRKGHRTLQRNLILSHCCGVGRPLDAGHDAADDGPEAAVARTRRKRRRWEVVELIEAMLRRGVTPVVPAGLGRRLGRSRAARAHGRGDDRRGRGRSRGQRCRPPRRWRGRGLNPITLGPRKGWR